MERINIKAKDSEINGGEIETVNLLFIKCSS